MRYLITSLKFGAHYKNARLLGLLLAEHLKITAQRPDLIVPIPLHNARYRQRGFNQVIEIAKTVSRELQIPLDLTSCLRHRDTPHQTALTAKQRRKTWKMLSHWFNLFMPNILQYLMTWWPQAQPRMSWLIYWKRREWAGWMFGCVPGLDLPGGKSMW